MKNFKLFKRLGAFITAIAVLASMGTVAFATADATVAINNVALADTDTAGVYEMTVSYTVTSGEIGSKGITMLAYGAIDDAELKAGENFTVYNSTDYKIAYVTQENPELDDANKGSISFNIDTTEEGAIQVDDGASILVLLGGDGVDAPASAIYPIPPVEVTLMDGDTEVTALATAIDVNLDSTTIEDAVKAALASYTVYEGEEAVAWTDVTVTVTENAEGEYAYKATLTTAQGSTTVQFNADITWTAEALAISKTSYNVAAADVAGEDSVASVDEIIAAVKAKVVAETIKVTKGAELEAVIADAADAITVAVKTAGFDGTAANDAVEFDVTLAAGTYGEAIVASALTATVTVKYTLESAPVGLLGDVNNDQSVDVMDASAVQAYAFFNTPLDRMDLADVNGDEAIDVMDASAIQAYAFFNTPFPTVD